MKIAISIPDALYTLIDKSRFKLAYRVSRSQYICKALAYYMGIEEDYKNQTGIFQKQVYKNVKDKPKSN